MRQLAVGGMAEVWLARQRGLEGFEKLVVVKRILPHLASNPDFVQMFLDEARTAADLRHSNVASVTDVGTEAGAYFIAMEYLHGQDLTHIVQRCRVRGERIPLQHVMQMVSDAAQGLDYAHRKVDRHGQAQQIVHRDVSPQNVLVTYEGATKVLDFGIASASHRTTHTDAGVVKGKYAYMSPEQFDGAALDARSDLFSLGVVLWELVTLQRLFWKPSDAETLRAVMECRVPRPSSLLPDCPEPLEELILNSLARSPSKRMGSCGDLAEALDALLEKMRLPHSPARVGSWLRGMFPEHTLDPTETPVVATTSGDAATRNEKLHHLPGSQTHRVASREGPGAGHRLPTGGSLPLRLNVVPALGPFVGRNFELAQLSTYFDQGARLVTVTGTAGEGKSRLAARFVELHPEHWKEKVWTVELSEARTPEAAARAVMMVCGLETDGVCETEQQLTMEVGRLLAGLGKGLLVLNHFELASGSIEQWLAAAPELSMLMTRSESLGLPHERVLPLSGLDADGSDSAAVRMFVSQFERAGGTAPSAASELDHVVQICALLEGLPLAIELVGARTDALNLGAIHEQLEAARAVNMTGAIDWTVALLSRPERRALSQLSVFRGGFTRAAAERIITLEPGEEVAFLLESLVRKSLLRAYVAPQAPGRLRFRLLQSVRATAAALLESNPAEAVLAHRNHSDWFLQLSEAWAEEMHGPASTERLAMLSVEQENLLEIFERAKATVPATADSTTLALRVLHGLDPWLIRTGLSGPHLSLLEQTISTATSSGAPKSIIARAMQARANVQISRGRPALALEGMTEALKIVREAKDPALEGRILCDWAQACFINADVDGAIAGLEQSLKMSRANGDVAFEVKALSLQAVVCVARRELTRALACCDEALPLARSRGDAVSEARVLGTVGSLFLEEQRTELARAFFSDAVARCEQANELALKGYFLGKLAQVLAQCGELAEAQLKLIEALRVLHQVGDLRHEGIFLSFSASLEALGGHPEQARLTIKAAESKLEMANDPLLLTAHALWKMQLGLGDGTSTPQKARTLLREVRTGQLDARPRVAQSDEVRLAALQLERTLGLAVA